MVGLNGTFRRAVVALGAAALLSAPASTQGPLSALGKLEPGLWQLRDLDSGSGRPEAICVADPNILMQLQHRNSPCARLVIASEARAATVHYTCPAHGFGRTTLKVETSRLVQIETQGIIDNFPFAYRAEARRVGACAVSQGRGGR